MMSKRLFRTWGGRKDNPQHTQEEKNMHLEACQGIAIPKGIAIPWHTNKFKF